MKRLLSIDPGSTESGWLIYQPGQRMLINGCAKESNRTVINHIRTKKELFDIILIEMLSGYVHFYPGSNQNTIGTEILNTAAWIGRFEQVAEDNNIESVRMPRKAVSAHLCKGIKSPRDTHVRTALINRFGEPGTAKNPGMLYGVVGDIWSALALAVSFSDKNVIQPDFKPAFLP